MTILSLILCLVPLWWIKRHKQRFNPTHPPAFVDACPVASRYETLWQSIHWKAFPEHTFQSHFLQPPLPYTAFVRAYLVKLDQGFSSMTRLRQYLCDHPALVWRMGFTHASHFDPDLVLPTARHLTRLLRQLPAICGQFLLDETVRLAREQLHDDHFGEAISLDTKHILAWVKENNPKAYTHDRFDKTKQPAGDPDCRLGCKRRHNQSPDRTTPFQNPQPASQIVASVGEFYWGYASGVVATKVADWGEFVLAEYTQTFDHADVSYFDPLMHQVEARLGHKPRFGAFDAAFDAFYVYDYFAQTTDWTQGFAAVPLSGRSHPTRFDPDGHPLCPAGLSFHPAYTFTCRTTLVEHERMHYICPLKAKDCPIQHPRAAKGGCTHRLPTSIGARLRHQIDHESSLYKEIYRQRTATERINSQAKALGIERPMLRHQGAIANQNTLIYVLINLRTLQRHSSEAFLAQQAG